MEIAVIKGYCIQFIASATINSRVYKVKTVHLTTFQNEAVIVTCISRINRMRVPIINIHKVRCINLDIFEMSASSISNCDRYLRLNENFCSFGSTNSNVFAVKGNVVRRRFNIRTGSHFDNVAIVSIVQCFAQGIRCPCVNLNYLSTQC